MSYEQSPSESHEYTTPKRVGIAIGSIAAALAVGAAGYFGVNYLGPQKKINSVQVDVQNGQTYDQATRMAINKMGLNPNEYDMVNNDLDAENELGSKSAGQEYDVNEMQSLLGRIHIEITPLSE